MEWTKKQIIETQGELKKWHGLPHIDRRALEGKGIDCIHLVFQALYASKLIEPRKLPAYRVRWGLVSPENMMAEGLIKVLFASRHKATSPEYGDIVIWKAGKQSNHCGFVGHDMDGGLACWHVMKGGKVHPAAINPIVHKAQELIRLDRAGWKIDRPDQIKLKDLNERK